MLKRVRLMRPPRSYWSRNRRRRQSGISAGCFSAGRTLLSERLGDGGTPRLSGRVQGRPKPGTTGGQVIFADWQEATEFNQYYCR
jgi:hypothetical protein